VKICWFDDYRLGLVDGRIVRDVTAALDGLSVTPYPSRLHGDALICNLPGVIERVHKIASGAPTSTLADVRFLSPVLQPTKIIGVPVNYLKHIEEAEAQREVFAQRYHGSVLEQGLFLKASSSLIGFGERVQLRFPERRTDHEMELGVVIGKRGSKIPKEQAFDHVAGYSIALDMVVRGPEDRSFRKSIDTYAVLGPWLVTADEIKDPQHLDFSLSVNGAVRQASNTRNMIIDIAQQISWASEFYTLLPGDIIMTGTCEGVSRVVPGDTMQCEIQGVGEASILVT
jgi:2-keto-4-pentenoate hydratase/2-oxohepta-3-ene-1,7-dioic acid hydratase in catechol pathway